MSKFMSKSLGNEGLWVGTLAGLQNVQLTWGKSGLQVGAQATPLLIHMLLLQVYVYKHRPAHAC